MRPRRDYTTSLYIGARTALATVEEGDQDQHHDDDHDDGTDREEQRPQVERRVPDRRLDR
jgi:hypothetical protein